MAPSERELVAGGSAAAMVHSAMFSDGRAFLGIVAKRSYSLPDVAALREREQLHIVVDVPDRRHDDDSAVESDLMCFHKPATDVLLLGSAHCHRGAVTTLETALRVGTVAKRIRVYGERSARYDGRDLVEKSAPLPFTRMPMGWTRAYGGRDRAAEAALCPDREALSKRRANISASVLEDVLRLAPLTYPRNRYGAGYTVRVAGRAEGDVTLPNLEDPDYPLKLADMLLTGPDEWPDGPLPACYGPRPPTTFPRCIFAGMVPSEAQGRALHELSRGILRPDDLLDRPLNASPDPRLANCAAAELSATRLYGNERVSLWNLHREHELLEFDLPGNKPRMLVEPPNTRAFDLEPVLQTVLIEPDLDRVTLTWTGSMAVASVYSRPMCKEMRHAVVWS